jgi:hypothetical protein
MPVNIGRGMRRIAIVLAAPLLAWEGFWLTQLVSVSFDLTKAEVALQQATAQHDDRQFPSLNSEEEEEQTVEVVPTNGADFEVDIGREPKMSEPLDSNRPLPSYVSAISEAENKISDLTDYRNSVLEMLGVGLAGAGILAVLWWIYAGFMPAAPAIKDER